MLNLSAKNIRLNGSTANKEEAIKLVAAGLVANGNVENGYEAGMLAREQQTSTFLGNGIAIPHGTLDTRGFSERNGRAKSSNSHKALNGVKAIRLMYNRYCGKIG